MVGPAAFLLPVSDGGEWEVEGLGELHLGHAQAVANEFHEGDSPHSLELRPGEGRVVRVGEGGLLYLLFRHGVEAFPIGLSSLWMIGIDLNSDRRHFFLSDWPALQIGGGCFHLAPYTRS